MYTKQDGETFVHEGKVIPLSSPTRFLGNGAAPVGFVGQQFGVSHSIPSSRLPSYGYNHLPPIMKTNMHQGYHHFCPSADMNIYSQELDKHSNNSVIINDNMNMHHPYMVNYKSCPIPFNSQYPYS
ncbi:hypothetical protein SLE2022_274840 [Rubroshorea leprosula]